MKIISIAKIFVILILASLSSSQTFAQNSITGVVLDAETGDTLPVAHISVIGTGDGTISNLDGEFVLELETLPAEIEVRYIGYKSNRLTIDENSLAPVEIRLQTSPILLETIIVSGDDPAVRIMREVIRRKQEWRKNIHTYRSDAYTRSVLSNDTEIVSISESISELFWDEENGHKEIVKAKRQTENMSKGENFAFSSFSVNLYDDDINILGFQVIGPTHPQALKYYTFELVEKKIVDDAVICEITMTPKTKLQPSFYGTLWVMDEVFALVEAKLKPSESIMFPMPIKKLNTAFEQRFGNFGNDFWLPVDVRVGGEIKISFPGLKFPWVKVNQLTLRVPISPLYFIYAIMRKPSVLEISIRSRMNFVRIDVLLESARNSVSVFLMAIAVTNSEGQIPGRMVRIHEPKCAQTSFGKTEERYIKSPCDMRPVWM